MSSILKTLNHCRSHPHPDSFPAAARGSVGGRNCRKSWPWDSRGSLPQLSQLKQAGLVADRRSGKNIIYTFRKPDLEFGATRLLAAIELAAEDLEEKTGADTAALKLALRKRKDKARAYFDQLGNCGALLPGRSWKALGETLLKLLPPMVIADLGAGEGTFSQLLAHGRRKSSPSIARKKWSSMAPGSPSKTVTKISNTGLETSKIRRRWIRRSCLLQSSLASCGKTRGRHCERFPDPAARRQDRGADSVLKHPFEDARELYADVWFGFFGAGNSPVLRGRRFRRNRGSGGRPEKDEPLFSDGNGDRSSAGAVAESTNAPQ